MPEFDLRAVTDDQLVDRFRAGNAQAFATLYERYVDRVYDLVARLVGDREVAADVTQETFVKALTGLRARRVQGSVRAWLFTIARNTAIDSLRRQRTTTFSRLATSEGEEWEPEIPASGLEDKPEEVAQRGELAELVWQAARGLNPSDYALLDLSLRHDFSPAELAQVVGARRGTINTRLSRLRDALEESLTVLLLARWGRHDCAQLDRLLDGVELPSGLTPQLRRTVARHVEQCELCRRTRSTVATAAELLPAVAPILPTPELRTVLDATVQQALAAPAPGGLSSVIGQLRGWLTGTAPGKAVLGTIGAVVVVVGVVGGWLTFGTATVAVTTSHCPPLELEFGRSARATAWLLGVPSEFRPGEVRNFRVPAGMLTVRVAREVAEIRLAGVPVEIQLAVPLAEVTWDGQALLGRGLQELRAPRGSSHTIELTCS